MWSCQSGSAGSRWHALEVQLTPAWTISRSGKNVLLVLPSCFTLRNSLFQLSHFIPNNKLGVMCACCLLMLYVQVQDGGRCTATCTRTAAETARPEQEIQQHWYLQPPWTHSRKWEIHTALVHETSCTVRNCIRTLLCYIHTPTDTHTFILLTFDIVLSLYCFAVLWWLRNSRSCRVYHIDLKY